MGLKANDNALLGDREGPTGKEAMLKQRHRLQMQSQPRNACSPHEIKGARKDYSLQREHGQVNTWFQISALQAVIDFWPLG